MEEESRREEKRGEARICRQLRIGEINGGDGRRSVFQESGAISLVFRREAREKVDDVFLSCHSRYLAFLTESNRGELSQP